MRHLARSALGLSLAGVVAVAAPASAEILIGGAICLTGVQAPLDEPGYKGALVAVKQINDAGGLLGQQVRFLNIDGKSDPVTVGNASAGSWGPGNWLAYLREFGHLDADAIILVASSHDMYDEPGYEPLNPATHPTSAPPLALWEGVTRYLPRYLPVLSAPPPPPPPPQASLAENARKSSAPSLRAIADYARAAQVPLCLVHHHTRSELHAGVLSPDGVELRAEALRLSLPIRDDAQALREAADCLRLFFFLAAWLCLGLEPAAWG